MSRKSYPVRIPRHAFGIRAQDLRVVAQKIWWTRRWLGAMESMRLGARLGRGRAYALSGQVIDLTVTGSHVEAHVVGSRSEPYCVTLDFATLPKAMCRDFEERFGGNPMTLGRLLAGDLPLEVAEDFAAVGLPLIPLKGVDKLFCSCPDWSKPCKHIAAVLFLLADEISRRPILLPLLRGVDLDRFILSSDEDISNAASGMGDLELTNAGLLGTASDPAALIRRLGPVPFWRGTEKCVDSLARMRIRMAKVLEPLTDGTATEFKHP